MNNLITQKKSQQKKVPLGTVLSSVIDKRGVTPKKLGSDWVQFGVPVISAKNIKNNSIVNQDQIRFIEDSVYQKWMPISLREGDIIMTSEAPMGELYLVKKGEKYCLGQRLFGIRANSEKLFAPYLFYFLQSTQGRHELQRRASGSTAEGIRQTELVQIEVSLPSLEVQKKISEILGLYDEKKALNNLIIENILHISQTLFDKWFVDSASHWEEVPLGDVIELAYGRALKSEDREDGKFPVVGSSGVVGFHSSALVKGPGIVVGRKGNAGSVIWINDDFYPIDTTFYVVTTLNKYFVYFLLKQLKFQSGDSAVPGLGREAAYSTMIFVPPKSLQDKFGTIIESNFNMIAQLELENKFLDNLKDQLLAKLI